VLTLTAFPRSVSIFRLPLKSSAYEGGGALVIRRPPSRTQPAPVPTGLATWISPLIPSSPGAAIASSTVPHGLGFTGALGQVGEARGTPHWGRPLSPSAAASCCGQRGRSITSQAPLRCDAYVCDFDDYMTRSAHSFVLWAYFPPNQGCFSSRASARFTTVWACNRLAMCCLTQGRLY
jgi:hypothetical protein